MVCPMGKSKVSTDQLIRTWRNTRTSGPTPNTHHCYRHWKMLDHGGEHVILTYTLSVKFQFLSSFKNNNIRLR